MNVHELAREGRTLDDGNHGEFQAGGWGELRVGAVAFRPLLDGWVPYVEFTSPQNRQWVPFDALNDVIFVDPVTLGSSPPITPHARNASPNTHENQEPSDTGNPVWTMEPPQTTDTARTMEPPQTTDAARTFDPALYPHAIFVGLVGISAVPRKPPVENKGPTSKERARLILDLVVGVVPVRDLPRIHAETGAGESWGIAILGEYWSRSDALGQLTTAFPSLGRVSKILARLGGFVHLPLERRVPRPIYRFITQVRATYCREGTAPLNDGYSLHVFELSASQVEVLKANLLLRVLYALYGQRNDASARESRIWMRGVVRGLLRRLATDVSAGPGATNRSDVSTRVPQVLWTSRQRVPWHQRIWDVAGHLFHRDAPTRSILEGLALNLLSKCQCLGVRGDETPTQDPPRNAQGGALRGLAWAGIFLCNVGTTCLYFDPRRETFQVLPLKALVGMLRVDTDPILLSTLLPSGIPGDLFRTTLWAERAKWNRGETAKIWPISTNLGSKGEPAGVSAGGINPAEEETDWVLPEETMDSLPPADDTNSNPEVDVP